MHGCMAPVFSDVDGQIPGFGKYINNFYFRLTLFWLWPLIVMRALVYLL